MNERRKYYKRSADYVPTLYKPTVLAYMAGIIDGEGCFYIGTVKKNTKDGYVNTHYVSLLKISNTDYSLIEWLKKTFAVEASACTRSTSSRKFEREVFDWVVTGDRLLDLSEQVLPFLVIKKPHCQNIIKFRQTYVTKHGCNKIPQDILDLRQKYLIESRNLNTRWHLHPIKQN